MTKIQIEDLGKSNVLAYLGKMLQIREFELRVEELFRLGELPGFVHSCRGQEATAVGACAPLRLSDFVTSTHRGHGHSIAKGISLNSIFAELFGKKTGACKGKGGSMHVADFSIGMLGANGIVGGGYGIATGAGLSIKYQQLSDVVVCFFGDGALNKGTFHESLNFAGLHKLPVIFVCENNGYAQFTDMHRTTASLDIAGRANSYGMPGLTVDGNNLIDVLEVMQDAVSNARQGAGSTLIDMKSYRMSGHYVGDAENYRSKDEVNAMVSKDPIDRFVRLAVVSKVLNVQDIEELHENVKKDINNAELFARESEFPAASEALDDVFEEGLG